jgi:hypothetical protein
MTRTRSKPQVRLALWFFGSSLCTVYYLFLGLITKECIHLSGFCLFFCLLMCLVCATAAAGGDGSDDDDKETEDDDTAVAMAPAARRFYSFFSTSSIAGEPIYVVLVGISAGHGLLNEEMNK